MTITLAAVYAPVGIQGGLTGALFREFAFTLAGAVIVSGVVALTLSPMMGAKLLRPGDTRARLCRLDQPPIRRRAPGVHAHARRHAALSSRRPRALGDRGRADRAVLHVLAARARAQRGSGRRVLDRPGVANSTIDQTKLFAQQVHDVYRSIPETASIFQLTFPTGGFGGMVTKPWSERTKTTEQLLMEVDGAAVADSRHPRDPADAAAAAGRRRLSRGLRHRLGGRAGAARRARRSARSEGVRERAVHVRRRRSEVRPAAGRGRLRSRQAALAGRRSEPGRARSVDAARR